MPHYKNGKPAQIGDLVLHTATHNGAIPVLGILTGIVPNSTACNGNLTAVAKKLNSGHWFPVTGGTDWCITLSECEPMTTEATAEAEQQPVPA